MGGEIKMVLLEKPYYTQQLRKHHQHIKHREILHHFNVEPNYLQMQQALKPCHHQTLELQVLFAHLNLFEPISQAQASMCSTPFVQLHDSHMNQQHCNHPYTNRCIGVPSFNYANSESADIQICKHIHHFTIFLGYVVQTIPLATDVILQTVLLNLELHLSENPNFH
jgi:hypothetical protein